MFDPPIDDAPSYDELVNKVLEQCSKIAALEVAVKNLTASNSRYVAVLEEDYHVLNRMGGALEGCRAELAIVIEHLNAAK